MIQRLTSNVSHILAVLSVLCGTAVAAPTAAVSATSCVAHARSATAAPSKAVTIVKRPRAAVASFTDVAVLASERAEAGPGSSSKLKKSELPVYSKPDVAVGPNAFKILVVGNSISHGMAASSNDTDYVHTLSRMIQNALPDKKVVVFLVNLVPGGMGTPDERLVYVKPFAAYKYDLIIIQHGEHEQPRYGVQGVKATYEKLLGLFDQGSEKPFVICVGTWTANHGNNGLAPGVLGGFWKTVPDTMAKISKEHGFPFVSVEEIAADSANRGYPPVVGVQVNAGVQWHPNDRGHRLYAEKIFKTFTAEAARHGLKLTH